MFNPYFSYKNELLLKTPPRNRVSYRVHWKYKTMLTKITNTFFNLSTWQYVCLFGMSESFDRNTLDKVLSDLI